MTTLVRRVTLTAFGIAALLLAAGALAWACTAVASPSITLSPQEGPAGTSVKVTGSDWTADEQLELQWRTGDQGYLQTFKSVTPDSSGNFATTITIPEATPDYYYVGAEQGSADTARPFHLTATQTSDGGDGDGSQTQESSSSTTSGETSDSSSDSDSDGSTSNTVEGGSDSSGTQDSGTTNDGSTSDSGTTEGSTSESGSTDTSGQTSGNSQPSTSGDQAAGTTTDTGSQTDGRPASVRTQTDTGASVTAPAAGLDGGIALDSSVDTTAPDRQQGLETLAGRLVERDGSDSTTDVREPFPADLWSDLAPGQDRDPVGLADRGARDPLSAMAAGVGLLAVGMLALALGFGVAEARRRRVTVEPTERD